MKKGILVAGFLSVLVIIGLVYFFFVRDVTPVPSGGDPVVFPGGTGVTPKSTMSVYLSDGSTVLVPDFTKENQPEGTSAEAGYQVAGNDDGEYQILYFPGDSAFLISLLAEPLGLQRENAEAELRNTLKLSDSELCKLNSQVATSIYVSETYAGQNLGLSFCPGSVVLP